MTLFLLIALLAPPMPQPFTTPRQVVRLESPKAAERNARRAALFAVAPPRIHTNIVSWNYRTDLPVKFTVEGKPSLAQPWQSLATNIVGRTFTFTTTSPQYFVRVGVWWQ